jgi:hypothetical protein
MANKVINSNASYAVLPDGQRMDLTGFVFATFPAGTELHSAFGEIADQILLAERCMVSFTAALTELDFPMLLRVLGVENIDNSYHGGERFRRKTRHGRFAKLDRRAKRRPIWKLTARRR